MTDSRTGYDEQLPWLEAVDDEDGPSGLSARRMLAALAMVVAAAAIVASTFYWLGRSNASVDGTPELIRAEPGPYRIKPDDPGGLDVAGESETAYETSAGEDPDGRLDLEALPPETVAGPAPTRPAEPPAAPEAPKPAPAEAAAPPEGGAGSIVQLGAYTSAAQAQRGWDALSARFPELATTRKLVVPFSGGFRLRAATGSAEEARRTCQALKAAGENCFVAR